MQPELEILQGTWNITALEVDGGSMPTPPEARMVIKKDRFESLGMGAIYQGKLVLDTTQKPWALDLKFTAGPEKGNTNRGIFEFKGESWQLCLQMTGGERPKKFSTKAGGGLALETLARPGASENNKPASAKKKVVQKDEKSARIAADFSAAPVPELAGEWAMVSCVMNGQSLEAEYVKMGRRLAHGNETTIFMGEQAILKARYAIDQTAQPNTIDYLLKNGQRQFGIFKLAGDVLEVSFAAAGKPRPETFSATKGDGRTVATWKLI